MATVLVTGGAGYVGSHAVVELIGARHQVVVVDNLCNSHRQAIERLREVTQAPVPFYEFDLRDREALDRLFAAHGIDAVMHFAGLKAVGESVAQPVRYFQNNLGATMTLLEVMQRHAVKILVFSSSATVYGDPERVPITEDMPTRPANPYGHSKRMIEQMLGDLARADPAWRAVLLRYFNPVGAHASGRIGEDPSGIPANLVPYIAQVAIGRLDELRIFGDDWPTADGTGVRDYIHVMDLVRGHVAALDFVAEHEGLHVFNLGTGRGTSVLEMLRAFERASGQTIPYRVVARRPGDIATCYADASAAARALGWCTERSIDDMCADAWRWQQLNPAGYGRSTGT